MGEGGKNVAWPGGEGKGVVMTLGGGAMGGGAWLEGLGGGCGEPMGGGERVRGIGRGRGAPHIGPGVGTFNRVLKNGNVGTCGRKRGWYSGDSSGVCGENDP